MKDTSISNIGAGFGFSASTLYENSLKNYTPLHNGVLLETVTVEEKTQSGIYIPEAVIEKKKATTNDSIAWKVAKVGPETVNVKAGDYVIIGPHTPIGVDLIEGIHLQVFENWIVGVFRKDSKVEDFKQSEALIPLP